MLLCPVRTCHQELTRELRRLFCPLGHSFDVARSGYVNLLQPQDRRSKNPGDTLEAVLGRRRLHDLGATRPLLSAMQDLLDPAASDTILDAGCGEGFYLGSLAAQTPFSAHGLDISIPAIDAAARRYTAGEWIVANADRFIPYTDSTFTKLVSITARMNPAEFRRVLKDGGILLIALPAPDDLQELRGGVARDRTLRTITEFTSDFHFVEQRRATTTAALDAATIQDVLHSIYRPLQAQPPTASTVTLSLDLLRFRKRS